MVSDRMHLIQRPLTQLQILLFLAIALGGGGVVYGYRHMVIQLAALALLAANPGRVKNFVSQAPRSLQALLAISVLLPLLQVVPLPAALWQALPGRDLVEESYQVADIAADSWFSFSVDPIRTLTAFCATLAPATIVILGWSLSPGDRTLLARSLVALALLVFALGAIQLSSGNTVALFQRIEPGPDILYGTFSNRNSTGLFFVIGAIVLAAVPLPKGGAWTIGTAMTGAMLVLGVILTQSRSSMALVSLLLLFLGIRFGLALLFRKKKTVPAADKEPVGRRLVLAGASLVLVLMVGSVALSFMAGGRAAQSFDRFSHLDDDRLEMWDDGAFVADRYWPMGAGTGTFDEVFQIDESLEYVSPARAGRAHNDYIELAIELGAVGVLLLLAWFAWIALATLRRRTEPDRWLAFAAYTSFIVIALQSMLDYPLRNQALLCTAALLVVLLLPFKEQAS